MLKDKLNEWIDRFNAWRPTHMTDRRFMLILSIPTGFCAGAAAVIISWAIFGTTFGLIESVGIILVLLAIVAPSIIKR